MANYATLKAAVADVVKTNGSQAITGANLQAVLLSIINSIGANYTFAGVATPSTSAGTPDQNVFYIGGAGTDSNFGSSSYTVPSGAVGVFAYNGSWSNSNVIITGDIYGDGTGVTAMTPNSHILSSSSARWCFDWDSVQVGDLLEIDECKDGYEYFVIASSDGVNWDLNITEEYQTTAPFLYLCSEGIRRLRILVTHTDRVTDMTSTDAKNNLAFGMTRASVMDRVLESRNVIKGNAAMQEDVAPTSSEQSNTTRWLVQWLGNVNNGDILNVEVKSGYMFSVFGKSANGTTGGTQWTTAYQNSQYTNEPFRLACNLGNASCIRVIISHTDQSQEITQAEVEANVTFSLTRSISLEQVVNEIEKEKKEISVLFIGNSLTQDAVCYAPLLLRSIAPEMRFKIHIYYNGGYKLTQQLAQMNANEPCDIFSICETNMFWWNRNNSVTMSDVLSKYKYDIICLQEYFNYMDSYTDTDKAAYDGILTYLKNNHQGVFKVATFIHPPKRDNIETIYLRTLDGVDWIMENTPTSSVLPAGVATYMAFDTELDNLGDQGHLSPDGTHSQEGLPCMLEAYVTALWVLQQAAIPRGILGNDERITAENYPLIEVAGPNLGTGVVVGTEAQYWLAQKLATMAFNKYQ